MFALRPAAAPVALRAPYAAAGRRIPMNHLNGTHLAPTHGVHFTCTRVIREMQYQILIFFRIPCKHSKIACMIGSAAVAAAFWRHFVHCPIFLDKENQCLNTLPKSV